MNNISYIDHASHFIIGEVVVLIASGYGKSFETEGVIESNIIDEKVWVRTSPGHRMELPISVIELKLIWQSPLGKALR